MAQALFFPDQFGSRLADTVPRSYPCQLGLPVGTLFGPDQRYELLKPVGSGGTSVVHEVHDRVLDRRLAAKFILCSCDHTSRSAAELEARATSRLNHPNIVTVHDVGVHQDVPYLLMELLEGHSLATVLTRQRLPTRRALAIALDVASALQHAHERGVFHFDLKPGNVHIAEDQTVKLLDFGVGSQRLDRPTTEEPADEIAGTPQCMAPEQWSLGTLDARTDVWALGVLLYECLTGLLPFDARQPGLACARGVPLTSSAPHQSFGLSPELELVIQRAVCLNPAGRFQSVASFSAALSMVSRLLIDEAVSSLSPLEQRVAAAADVPNHDFTDADVDLLTSVPRSLLVAGLQRLVQRGALMAQGGRSRTRYHNVDRSLTRACFERLPTQERRRLLAQRLELAAAAGTLASRHARDPLARP